MKIAVIVKEVPDTEARILLKDGRPDLASVNMVINPYDEYAVEEALRLTEKHPDSTVTAIFVGSESSRKSITNVLALGVADAVLIADPAVALLDPLQVAQALAAVLSELKPDVILGGKQGVDYDFGLTAIAVAEFLGLAHVGLVSKLDLADGKFRAESDGDEGKLITEGRLPAVFTAEKALNEPRYASLKGIMAAKKKPVAVKTLGDLGLDAAGFGQAGAKVQLVGCDYPAPKAAGRMIEGETVQDKVTNLVKALREEAKVI
jgi:electron transfer flavoprotein beta subunit